MPLEPPYGIIWNRLKQGRVIPFLGAGASFVERPVGALWEPKHPTFLPSGLELAQLLANEAEFPSVDPRDREDLAKVCSYYADISGRSTLRERLREVLNHDYLSGPLHALLASVQAHQVIVTTNYDTLIEQAFKAENRPYDLVIYPADRKDIANAVIWWPHGSAQPVIKAPNELDVDLTQTTVIFKMHGTIYQETAEWDNFVITEEDYVEFLSRMTSNAAIPSLFIPYFRERSFLFLGYGLRDWNLRVVLRNLSKSFSKRADDELPSWAIQYKPSDLERALWEKRGVKIFDISLDDFVRRMHATLGS
jgi:hypothetical protein